MIDEIGRPCRVFLFGSCVCRDVFERLDRGRFELADFVARSSLGSSFCGEWDLGSALALIESSFWRRLADIGARSQVMNRLLDTDYEILVLDFVDERLPIMLSDGRALTVGGELLRSGIVEQVGQGAQFVRSGTKRHFELWCAGLACLANLLESRPDVTPILLPVKWAPKDNLGRPYPPKDVTSGNQYLDLLYRMARENLARLVILDSMDELCVADAFHRWGPAPFHYVEPYYQQFVHGISSLTIEGQRGSGQIDPRSPLRRRSVYREAV